MCRQPGKQEMWPRRKSSDLMDHMFPRPRGLVRRGPQLEQDRKPVQIPIARPAAKIATTKDQGWPRRKKSDLYIYQQTRNL